MLSLFRPLLVVAFGLLLNQTTAQTKFNFATDIGIVVAQDNGRMCLFIKRGDLRKGATILIANPAIPDASLKAILLTGKIIALGNDACNDSEAKEYGDSCYVIHLTKGHLFNNLPYFAILTSLRTLSIKGADVVGDLDGDGKLEYLRQCTSSEGVHLTVWTDVPEKGERRWHHYFYLGYEVVPSCQEKDTQED